MGRDFIPFHVPEIGQPEIDDVVDTLRSGWITTGPKTARFETKFSEYVVGRHALAVNSCTAGLHLALAGLGVGPGDEVITTPLTFAATVHTILQVGATPVLADIDPDGNLSPDSLSDRITPRTRAILPVHLGGLPCSMDRIWQTAQEHDLFVVEDAAHAVGGRYRNSPIGGYNDACSTASDAVAFSFYATKNITTGEGGMVTTEDAELAERMRRLSLHGISRDIWERSADRANWRYEVIDTGFKYNMSDIQAAIGIHQLAKLESLIETRARYARLYHETLSGIGEIDLPADREDRRHAWHLYAVRLRLDRLTLTRAEFMEELRRLGIGTSVHFIPIPLHRYFADQVGLDPAACPGAIKLYERSISLPLYPAMTIEQVRYVAESVKQVVARHNSAKVIAATKSESAKAAGGESNSSGVLNTSAHRTEISDFRVAELLGRKPVQLDESRMREGMRGRAILVTGAAGSIGSELSRRIAAFEPRRLLLLDQAESALFRLEAELQRRFPALDLVSHIVNIRDRRPIDNLLACGPLDSIFHAAAYKHVPLMERHPLEAAETNVLGTWNLVDSAHKHGVSSFLMISSDKAVNPANVMGLTKRAAEIIVASVANRAAGPKFLSVRFGNVLGSSGSVVPLFAEQIAAGGPVTVTHPDVRRYFMTVSEAAGLVLEASTMGKGSEIFVLDMGRPIRIADLAERMIRLGGGLTAGLTSGQRRGMPTGKDIEIRYTGLRPGDKLSEELTSGTEQLAPTPHEKIKVVRNPGRDRQDVPAAAARTPVDQPKIDVWIEELTHLISSRDEAGVVNRLAQLVPEYEPARRLASTPAGR